MFVILKVIEKCSYGLGHTNVLWSSTPWQTVKIHYMKKYFMSVGSWSPRGVTQRAQPLQSVTFCQGSAIASELWEGRGFNVTLSPLLPPTHVLTSGLGAQSSTEQPHASPSRLPFTPTLKSGPLEIKPPSHPIPLLPEKGPADLSPWQPMGHFHSVNLPPKPPC